MHSKRIGVLALQGAFAKHAKMLNSLGVIVQEVRKHEDLKFCDGLIIPGGESTTVTKLLTYTGLNESIYEFALNHSIMGTCAGLILMASSVLEMVAGEYRPSSKVTHFNLLDVVVERNAYGRQIESFETVLDLTIPNSQFHSKLCNVQLDAHQTTSDKPILKIPALFIRAPKIQHCGEKVQILATFNNTPVVVKQGHHLGLTFHPELTKDTTLHQYWIETL